MNRWKQSIMRGDTEYRLRCFGSAILKYKQALGQAIDEFQDFVRQYQTRLDEAQQLRYQGKAAAIFRNERHLALRH